MLSQPGTFFAGLLGYYIAVTIPFLFAGLAIATPLAAYPHRVNRLYAADLLGAGLGCLAAVLALTELDAAGAITVCAAIFIAAGALYMGPAGQAGLLAAVAVGRCRRDTLAGQVLDFVPTDIEAIGPNPPRCPRARYSSRNGARSIESICIVRRTVPAIDSFGGAAHRDGHRNTRATTPEVLDIEYDGHNGSNVYRYEGRTPWTCWEPICSARRTSLNRSPACW